MTPRGGRTAPGTPADALLHWAKAKGFRDAAEHAAAAEYWDAACSNAILSSIHLATAATLQFRGVRSASQNHTEAIELLEGITEMEREAKGRFVAHFSALLALKSLVQYSETTYGAKETAKAIVHLGRAFAALAGLAERAGWR